MVVDTHCPGYRGAGLLHRAADDLLQRVRVHREGGRTHTHQCPRGHQQAQGLHPGSRRGWLLCSVVDPDPTRIQNYFFLNPDPARIKEQIN